MPHSTLSASRRQRTSESEARAPFSSFRSNDGDPFNEDSTPYTTYGAGAGSVAASPSTSPCASVSPPAGLSPETNALCAQAPSAAASFTRKVTAWLPQRKSSSPAGTLIPLESKRSKADAAGTKGKAAHAVPPLQLVGRINADNAAASQRGTSITLRSPTFIVTPRGAVPVSPRVGMTTTATTPVATTPTPRNPPTTRPRSLSSAPMVPVRHQTTPPPVLTAGSKSSGIAAAAAATGAASTLPRQGASATREPFLDAQPAVPPKMRLSGEGGCIISSSSNHNNGAGQPSAGSPAEAAAASSSAIGKPTPVVGNHARATARRSVSRSCSTLCFVTDTSASSALASLEEEELRPNAARPPFFSAAPARGDFVAMIEWLLCRGEQRDIGLPPASVSIVNGRSRSPRLTPPPPTFFTEDNITKLCTAATQVLSAEPGLLELDVPADDTLIVVGDIHGQFQDLYTSVLCQQYDRRRCNPGGLDRHFLFMGDYVDRGPHSLEVVLLLLALKVEYPSLVYLTRGNHEEEKTSRVYGFLTEATSSLGAVAGGAVWSAVNKVFLDLPLAAIVQTPHMRFFVTHGGLSPCLSTVEEIAAVNRNRYSAGDITADQDDMVTGLLWSDPTNDVPLYKRNPRGCGFLFGPTASSNFCAANKVDFICRAHQVAMNGYFWTHNDRVVTVFSAPNYCGVNGNKGAVLVVNGHNRRPILKQYESIEAEEEAPGPRPVFPYSSMFS